MMERTKTALIIAETERLISLKRNDIITNFDLLERLGALDYKNNELMGVLFNWWITARDITDEDVFNADTMEETK